MFVGTVETEDLWSLIAVERTAQCGEGKSKLGAGDIHVPSAKFGFWNGEVMSLRMRSVCI